MFVVCHDLHAWAGVVILVLISDVMRLRGLFPCQEGDLMPLCLACVVRPAHTKGSCTFRPCPLWFVGERHLMRWQRGQPHHVGPREVQNTRVRRFLSRIHQLGWPVQVEAWRAGV